jgi:FAD dependent oxidoreductase
VRALRLAILVGLAFGPVAGGSGSAVAGNVMSADVVVVGADAAGLGAAITAATHGLHVILVCNVATPGGMLSAGQIGFVDGSPIFSWDEKPNGQSEGTLGPSTAWSTTGGAWRTFRMAVASLESPRDPDIEATARYEPRIGAEAVAQIIKSLPTLTVLTNTDVVSAAIRGGRVSYAQVSGPWSGRLTAAYWVDGSDSGDFVGLLGLPTVIGTASPTAPDGDGVVMSYAYRWTAIEENIPGYYPTSPPPYYAQNYSDYRAATSGAWPAYQAAFSIPGGAAYWVHPFRLFNNQGRLSGAPNELIADPTTGTAPAGEPTEIWDVNNGPNDAGAVEISRMLASNDALASAFDAAGLPDPYGESPVPFQWADIAWVTDRSGAPPTLRALIASDIRDAVKDRALGFLWYVRSGDLQARLRQLPGGQNLLVRSDWSIDNELGTADGMPEEMYEREGRRIKSVYTETIADLCPTYATDIARPDHTCQSAPRYLPDGVVVDDYPADIHVTGNTPPQSLNLPIPHQLSFRTLIPAGTVGLLVGGAIGVDRLTYGAFRVDPVRMMIGTAIGDAVVEAKADSVVDFRRLNVENLRERLADDHQQTFFVPTAPTLSVSGSKWTLDRVGTAIQKLIARGWLAAALPGSPIFTADLAAPQRKLAGDREFDLDQTLRTSATAPPCSLPWLSHGRWTRSPVPTIGDAYLWLAAQPFPETQHC